MKTTIELSSDLLSRAKQRAAMEHSSLRSLVEEALGRLLDDREARDPGYQLPERSVGGNGLRPDLAAGGWDGVRDAVYQGRGA